MTLKLGYKASAEQFAPRQLLDFSVLAEQSGFDTVFVSDHFQPWKHTDGHAPSALVWLGALGASTRRIVMGTSVLTPTFRYHPSVVAQAFGTLGSMYPWPRHIWAWGREEGLNEVPSTGMVWPEMKERFARLREAISLIRKLWSEDHLSFEGEYYKTQDATIYDKPGQPSCRSTSPAQARKSPNMLAAWPTASSARQRQKMGPIHRDAAAERRAEGLKLSSKPKPDLRSDDRDESLVRHG